MILCSKLKPRLISVGYFVSPVGGTIRPIRIRENMIYFELITEGFVSAEEGGVEKYGAGTFFQHMTGDYTVSKSNKEGHYACFTAAFQVDDLPSDYRVKNHFLWDDLKAVLQFSEELLYGFHREELDREVLGNYILSQFALRLEKANRRELHSEVPSRMSAVLKYIQAHYGEAIGVDDLAAHVGLSSSHLHSIFREFLKQTPYDYIVDIRMRAAAHKLVTSNDPIKVIASEVGYANAESFCRAFKKHYERTAGSHRKLYSNYIELS